MKIVTWNVNSIKARLGHVVDFIKSRDPDVLMLQELKGLEFPAQVFQDSGYESLAKPQKAYNGVAILSKTPLTPVLDHLEDEQARYLEVEVNNLRVINIYLPNGNPVFSDPSSPALSSPRRRGPGTLKAPDPGFRRDDSEKKRDDAFSVKFDYKLGWMEKLYRRLKELRAENIPFFIGGDFNVIPEAKDCFDPKVWENDALYRIESRKAFRKLLNLGLTDGFRIFNPNAQEYTYWDYFAGRWDGNQGIRIDHFLLSPEVTDRCVSCSIDREPRGWEKPSDHTPVILEIAA